MVYVVVGCCCWTLRCPLLCVDCRWLVDLVTVARYVAVERCLVTLQISPVGCVEFTIARVGGLRRTLRYVVN